MFDATTPLSAIHRPATLVRAARIAAGMQPNRNRLLARVLRFDHGGPLDSLAERIHECEAFLESQRQATDPAYSAQRHVEALAALIVIAGPRADAEAVACAQTSAVPMADHAKASGSDCFRPAT